MQRVRPAEAARQLGLNKSTISRWLKKHPALLGDDGLVDVEELRAHRDGQINPNLQTRGPAAEARDAPDAAPTETPRDHRARYEKARADDAELDLAERLGETLRRRDVEAAVAEAAATLNQAATRVCRDRAERLVRIDDPRAMQTELEKLVADVLRAGTEQLGAAIGGTETAHAA